MLLAGASGHQALQVAGTSPPAAPSSRSSCLCLTYACDLEDWMWDSMAMKPTLTTMYLQVGSDSAMHRQRQDVHMHPGAAENLLQKMLVCECCALASNSQDSQAGWHPQEVDQVGCRPDAPRSHAALANLSLHVCESHVRLPLQHLQAICSHTCQRPFLCAAA